MRNGSVLVSYNRSVLAGKVEDLRYAQGMDSVQNGWFTESNDLWPGQRTSLEVEEVLYRGKSKYQDIMVVKR